MEIDRLGLEAVLRQRVGPQLALLSRIAGNDMPG